MTSQSIFLTLSGPWRIPIQLDISLLPLAVVILVLTSGSHGLTLLGIILISILLH